MAAAHFPKPEEVLYQSWTEISDRQLQADAKGHADDYTQSKWNSNMANLRFYRAACNADAVL